MSAESGVRPAFGGIQGSLKSRVRGVEDRELVDPRHRYPPTLTEIAIVKALAHGKSRKELARELAISYATLSRHIYNIQIKMGAQSAEQLVYLAVKQGLIE